MVPAALAGGIMALYPAIAGSMVDRFGRGFEPGLVALYVATLVGLFIADAWVRDRRLARSEKKAWLAERKAEFQRMRADELRFVLDVANDLDGEERIETALSCVLEKLRSGIEFTSGYVFLRGPSSQRLTCRGISPLTARAEADVCRFAEQAADSAATADILMPHTDPERAERMACPIRSRRSIIGVIVLELPGSPDELLQARLLTTADRLGASLNGVLLLAELKNKEQALRQAYRELRLSGSRVARSRALEEAAMVGEAAGTALEELTVEARAVIRQMERQFLLQGTPADPRLGKLTRTVDRLQELRDELSDLGQRTGQPTDQQVNDVLVAVLDLVTPDLNRDRIEVRLSLDQDLPEIRMDDGFVVHLLTRLFRRVRASLRRTEVPRRITVSTRPYGDGVRILLEDNSAGLDTDDLDRFVRREADASCSSSFSRALESRSRDLVRGDQSSHGVSIRTEEILGQGRRIELLLRGIPVETASHSELV